MFQRPRGRYFFDTCLNLGLLRFLLLYECFRNNLFFAKSWIFKSFMGTFYFKWFLNHRLFIVLIISKTQKFLIFLHIFQICEKRFFLLRGYLYLLRQIPWNYVVERIGNNLAVQNLWDEVTWWLVPITFNLTYFDGVKECGTLYFAKNCVFFV